MLMDESFGMAGPKSKKVARIEPTSWLIPANPKYYDVEKAFAESDTILWKQSNTVIVGDMIYLYLASPVSCVMYQCKAVEVNIPYEYEDRNLHIKKAMKIQRLHTYDKGQFALDTLKEHGITSVRGPRNIPYSLLYQLEDI